MNNGTKDIKEAIEICKTPTRDRSNVGNEIKVSKKGRVCAFCGKYYKFPTFIFKPRDIICATCENKISIKLLFGKALKEVIGF